MINQRADIDLRTKFPKFPSEYLYSPYHEKLIEFVQSTLTQFQLRPATYLEIGSSLGRTYYEVCKNLESVSSATLVEPSQNFYQNLEKLLKTDGPHEFPVIVGLKETSKVWFQSEFLRKTCARVKATLLNESFQNATSLKPHDLVLCSNVIDQCEDPKSLVELSSVAYGSGRSVGTYVYVSMEKIFSRLKSRFYFELESVVQ